MFANMICRELPAIRKTDAQSIYSEYLRLVSSDYTDKNEAIGKLEYCLCGDCLLDDLGCEKNTAASKDFFETLLSNMYNRWKQERINCFILTTNLSLVDIKLRYGDRVYSRMREMFSIWQFPNIDYRQKDKQINKA
jgi:hypothetical protein